MQNDKKLTHQIVERVRESILSGASKPGDRVANEKELMEEFGVGKATMREALRVLEATGLIQIRKGVNGGAYVAEVDMTTTIHNVVNFLRFPQVSISDLTMLRYFVEPRVAQIAALKRTEEDIEQLRSIIGETDVMGGHEIQNEIGFHCYLARITKNPMLIVAVDFADNILKSIKVKLALEEPFYRMVKEHHKILLTCLIAKDSQAAAVMMTNDLLEVGKSIALLCNCAAFDPSELTRQTLVVDSLLSSIHLQRVVHADDPLLYEPGVVYRKVGDSNLRLISYRNN